MTKKILAAMLLLSLAFGLLAACGEGPSNQSDNTDNATTTKPENLADAQQETTQERIYPDLESRDFGGRDFTFASRFVDNQDWTEWKERDLVSEELNGDVINDAVYVRNRKIEDKYNITIKEVSIVNPDLPAKVNQSIKSGDDLYDAVITGLMESASMAQNGSFVDLFGVPHLDLSKPWWSQGTVRDLSIMNKLFLIQGDLIILDNDSMEAMIFNKTLIQEYEYDNPYDLVKAGDWTFDKLIEMSKSTSKDLNGDGKMYIKDDLFGCIAQADSNISFIISGGDKIGGKDERDYPIITYGTERSYRIADILDVFALDEDNFINLHRFVGEFPVYDEQVKMMEDNRALFSWIRMRIVERLRGMETDFGILPLPKLDKAQENYITNNNPHTGSGLSIPVSASDLERTGMILEDLSAESRYTLQPAYYEINLRGKYARDDESQEMLDIILSNVAHDIGYVYNFGNFAATILYYGMNKNSSYASTFEKMQGAMEKAIDKVVEAYEKLD
ncbi:MAG: hypothetical protein FWH48_08345 [Oscillospiraceae bacterium]|nr:hypothetical protein [Oscillospiraceae bacterium]